MYGSKVPVRVQLMAKNVLLVNALMIGHWCQSGLRSRRSRRLGVGRARAGGGGRGGGGRRGGEGKWGFFIQIQERKKSSTTSNPTEKERRNLKREVVRQRALHRRHHPDPPHRGTQYLCWCTRSTLLRGSCGKSVAHGTRSATAASFGR